eukprot:CAMPEP_0180648670 /NCGR_PEP_ID=MMETSP1037_2-20121125/51110_1 /TAXON_ID=632150 /ORGANISM="Azadinium spinosum, Strain 3D9" /LENGTH=41 /DNA_ID= /DNA_START= /DNA_END= /DNA_ORIENTATION=
MQAGGQINLRTPIIIRLQASPPRLPQANCLRVMHSIWPQLH